MKDNFENISKLEQTVYFIVSFIILLTLCVYIIFIKTDKIGIVIITLSILLISYCFVSILFSIKKSMIARSLALAFISSILTCLGVEIMLHIFNYPIIESLASERQIYKTTKTVLEMNEQGMETFPFISPDHLHILSNLKQEPFLSNIPNVYVVSDEEDEGMIFYKTDENGFRNESGSYDQNSTFDFFLLGESHTQGAGVSNGYIFADQLRKKTSMSVYNAGMGGTGVLHQLGIFIEFGLQKKPKNVILTLVEAVSFNRAQSEFRQPLLREYSQTFAPYHIVKQRRHQTEVLKQYVQLEYLKSLVKLLEEKNYQSLLKTKTNTWLNQLKSSSRILQLINLYLDPYHKDREGYPQCDRIREEKKRITPLLSYLEKTIDSYGGNFYVVYLPNTRWFLNEWTDCEYEWMVSLCKELEIPMIDMVAIMKRYGNPRSFYARNKYVPSIGGHPNRVGHELIADQILSNTQGK